MYMILLIKPKHSNRRWFIFNIIYTWVMASNFVNKCSQHDVSVLWVCMCCAVLCCAGLCEWVDAVCAFYICFNKLRLENSLYRQNNFHEHTFIHHICCVCVLYGIVLHWQTHAKRHQFKPFHFDTCFTFV